MLRIALGQYRRWVRLFDRMLYKQSVDPSATTLRQALSYQPQELRFGTSGRRGELIHLTQLEVYINALAELRYLQSLPAAEGGIRPGDEFFFAYDLRPSSTAFAASSNGAGESVRGELCQAIQQAITDAGMTAVNLGAIPTPALTYYALSKSRGSIMVTGSHIPFDRNGYKLNTSAGELLKVHEGPIGQAVARVREELYGQAAQESPFDASGMFQSGHRELPPANPDGLGLYRERYLQFFPEGALRGKRYLVYQHSAVGRDLLPELLRSLGAEVQTAGRSDTFVPIDTENIDDSQLAAIQDLATRATAASGAFDAVVSTDGDSDRPLLLGVETGPGANGNLRFFGGDLLGMIVAGYLRADAVVVPISCNDAIDRGELARVLRPKTKIGSPFVIAGMDQAVEDGARVVCGWEANGGFLLGSDVERDGRRLKKLATRDAMLPILSVLAAAAREDVPLTALFDQLPQRHSRAALLKNFPRAVSLRILEKFDQSNREAAADLQKFFSPDLKFAPVQSIDYTDGVRISFESGEVAHLRPSGNADEFRIYAVADSRERASEIAALGIREPDGILRKLEQVIAAV